VIYMFNSELSDFCHSSFLRGCPVVKLLPLTCLL